MATQYSADTFAPKVPIETIVLRAHRVLEAHGLTLDPNPEVWVDDQDADNEIPEYIATSIEDAARHISHWPHSSSLGYSLRQVPKNPQKKSNGYVVHVFYTPNRELSVLGFAFIGDAFKPDEFPNTLPVITSLVEALHEEFSAYRSEFDWGLSDDVSEEDEVAALASGHAIPRPWQWLDIIDRALIDTDLMDRYHAAMKGGSVLRHTANGSLFWQRDAGPP